MKAAVFQTVPEGIVRKKTEYPLWSMLAIMGLLYLAPFVSMWLAVPAFLICVCRIVRYNARVFAVDYAMLLTVLELFRLPGGMSLMIFLCVFAGGWYFICDGVKADGTFVVLVVMLCYLLTRMQMDFSNFLLCFGQLFMLFVLIPKQDRESAELASKMFCVSLIISSIYGMAFRDTSQMYAVRGAEAAVFWGGSLKRFQGVFDDPNYYMSLITVGLALTVKLRYSKCIGNYQFVVFTLALSAFGVITYSKTFFLMYLFLVLVTVVGICGSKKPLRSVLLLIVAMIVVWFLLFSEYSPFAVVMERFVGSSNMDEFTTGRSKLIIIYWKAITDNIPSFLFGKGFISGSLSGETHNFYIEILYYIGFVGLGLYAMFFGLLMHILSKKVTGCICDNWIACYLGIIVVMIVYFSLHGMMQFVSYGCCFLALISVLIIPHSKMCCYPKDNVK